jgi:hypothetical protein
MKKLMIIFIGVGMTLVSCKTHLESLASNTSDDVYYNPAKERKPNVAPQPAQYAPQQQQQYYNPNAGKIGATAADQNNPYYKDPSFNYDDYYDNAYAARINRFQNPIYGTGYYDPYYTNQYTYTGNPAQYGTSIYSSYNMGSPYGYGSSNYYPGQGYGSGYGGYYSPSQTFNNAFYNPYYSGYGGYGGGYGSGLSIGMGYGMGYGMGMGGYNPYGMMGYGCSPYGMGMGYNPYGMGYNPYGMMGYGGYSPYGMGMYSSPMYASGYYNSYDYNSSTYHYGPRGSHSGGNSTTNAPMPTTHRRDALPNSTPEPSINTTPAVAPYAPDRFTQASIPQENYIKMTEVKTQSLNGQFQPNFNGQAAPNNNITIPHGFTGNNYNGSNNNPSYNGSYNGSGTKTAPGGFTGTPSTNFNGNTVPEIKTHRWFSGSNFGDNSNNNSNNNYQPNSHVPTRTATWGGGSFGGGSFGGSSGGGGSHSGGEGGHRGR